MSSTLDYPIMLTDHQAVERFIERLAAFSLDEWLSVAGSLTRDASSRAEANAMLEQLVAQHKLGVEAWSIADDVETALQYSIGSMRCAPSGRDSASLRLARQAASTAALALLVRPLLTTQGFESLYHPFAAAVPPSNPIGRRGTYERHQPGDPARCLDSSRRRSFSQPLSLRRHA